MKTTFLLALIMGTLAAGCANDDTDGADDAAAAAEDLTGGNKTIDTVKGTIGGVGLGATATALVAAMKPASPVVTKQTFQGVTNYERYRYGAATNFHVEYENGRSSVFYAQTSDPKYKTAAGIGVGSALSEVKAGVANAHCFTDPHGSDSCAVALATNGAVFFSFKNHRVSEIALSYVDGGE